MAKIAKLGPLKGILDKYFTRKYKYWYVLAINDNIDTQLQLPDRLKCLTCVRTLRELISTHDAVNSMLLKKGITFTVLKTALYIPHGLVVPYDQTAGAISTSNPLWTALRSYTTGVFDASGLTNIEHANLVKFATNVKS